MTNDIVVSVICLAYNHEKYIKECLDSIINQITTFKFEVVINDDASTDDTANIIEEYEKKYPELIKAIYQKENQYSQGVAIIEEKMLDYASGKYVAFCECDDKWTDLKKLQRQYEYMEKHPECSMCVHNTVIHDLSGTQNDVNFNSWNKEHILTQEEVFMAWKVHTSSYFVRKEDAYRPKEFRKYWFGDYVRLTLAYTEGNIVALPYIMSQYNYGVKTGALHAVDYSKLQERKAQVLSRKDFLENLNKRTQKRFSKIIDKRIRLTTLEADTLYEKDVIKYSKNKSEILKAVKKISEMESYKRYISGLNILGKIKETFRYKGYILYPLWVKIWKK